MDQKKRRRLPDSHFQSSGELNVNGSLTRVTRDKLASIPPASFRTLPRALCTPVFKSHPPRKLSLLFEPAVVDEKRI